MLGKHTPDSSDTGMKIGTMNLEAFVCLVSLIAIFLIRTYWIYCRQHPWDKYYPKLAWLRGGMYFCFCYLISYFSGAMESMVNNPIFTEQHLTNPSWTIYTIGNFAFIMFAYAGVWCYYTPVFERQRNFLWSAIFGFLWGSSSGQIFLSIWMLTKHCLTANFPIWAIWLLTWSILGIYQPNWHSMYWDHYVAPEHDTPLTQKIKPFACHIPNLTITLTYVAVYENYTIFVLLQILACMSASIGMRFPSPWAEPNHLDLAQRNGNNLTARCTGYLSNDYQTDPYTPFYPGWKKPDARTNRVPIK